MLHSLGLFRIAIMLEKLASDGWQLAWNHKYKYMNIYNAHMISFYF